jgi:hypothetical protein
MEPQSSSYAQFNSYGATRIKKEWKKSKKLSSTAWSVRRLLLSSHTRAGRCTSHAVCCRSLAIPSCDVAGGFGIYTERPSIKAGSTVCSKKKGWVNCGYHGRRSNKGSAISILLHATVTNKCGDINCPCQGLIAGEGRRSAGALNLTQRPGRAGGAGQEERLTLYERR